MAEPLLKPWTVDDFFEWEAQQADRYEFVDGIVYMMVGGSAAHAAIVDNITARLNGRPGAGNCRAYSRFKVQTQRGGYYPDVTVACPPLVPTEDRIREPTVIIEVLSETTADRDSGKKWRAYQEIASLQHYVMVSQDERRVDIQTRIADGWHRRIIVPPERSVSLHAIGVELALDEIYEDSGA